MYLIMLNNENVIKFKSFSCCSPSRTLTVTDHFKSIETQMTLSHADLEHFAIQWFSITLINKLHLNRTPLKNKIANIVFNDFKFKLYL